ncbi:Zn-ribbon domain-containing OB-fold protein [Streptomyces endophytica]|uniref:Zn-ribbon domain-containing OB-fold protein n=1 Tax=Streptomyces endophytica TaxID=2991496 RepID=A0ABY6PAN1_9ACTN|nr:Zn-ribbon domain-containing OB-fold protein [Streptomyces endophytica]UZJ30885.1 Zn-ribbon domain-containing OB-fold protein [Streptomyces endophytica]
MRGAARSTARSDVPEVDAFTRPYWEAAAQGRLLLRRCRAEGCGRAHHYPREFCPYCWSEDVDWEPAAGRGTLYTWSVVHRNDLPPFGDRVPYVAAVVDLAEGPRMMTEIVGCPEADLRIGMPLVVDFRGDGDAGPGDAGPGDAGLADTGPGDAGPGGAGPGGPRSRDAGPGDTVPGRAGCVVPVFRPAGNSVAG